MPIDRPKKIDHSSQTHNSLSLGREILSLLDPFFEASLRNAPLAANFKRWHFPLLNHSMNGSLRDSKNLCDLFEGKKPGVIAHIVHKPILYGPD
jgi:hypothetical protein